MRKSDLEEIASLSVNETFWFASASTGVKHEKWIFRVHYFGCAFR